MYGMGYCRLRLPRICYRRFHCSCTRNKLYKNAFQWDAYRPLVARISQHVLLRGGYLVREGTWSRGVCLVSGDVPGPGGCVPGPRGIPGPRGVYLVWGVYWSGGYLPRYSPPVDRMTDTCKNITFANFDCGR